ncbi:hypothetical protein JAAARDRAFT_67479 [Jaapia argillacea MUCL 33604]|uniref:Peptidase C14 caspase domain-containing protein n=1 Tax=Jaapia argillacea MUCL 33604 TaxID=933084 RepID=A0A067QC57_9AGAM|nr:hypothetical protein JAAARDRAFT_67479 [Jaapia argillacea MUCL 33604]
MRLGFFKPSVKKYLGFLYCGHHPSTENSTDSSTAEVEELPRLYALIIAINEYASPAVGNLKGAVADAAAMKAYLEEDLGVPETQIRFLRDAEATRRAIIQQINDLIADQRIRRGDPILIFYAGHGGEADAPDGWEAGDSKIQMLVPVDFKTTVDEQVVHGIPDRTIGALLSRLAEEWGDNITVILDCCHSGSGTRGDNEDRIPRFTEISHNIPPKLDIGIWGDARSHKRAVVIAPGFLHHGLRSHILLAACGAKEFALEENGRGVFTSALLTTLSGVGAQNITYANLLQRLQGITEQNPQCEGFYRNRVLFDAKAQSQGKVLFKVEYDGNEYVMESGTARGIDIGDEFTLYKDPEPSKSSSSLAIFVVTTVYPMRSVLTPVSVPPRFRLNHPAFALQTKAGAKHDLRIYVAKHKKLTTLFKVLVPQMQRTRPDRPRIMQVGKGDAEMGIDIQGKEVVFDILDERLTKFNLHRIPFSAPLDSSILHPILDAAAHFHWHLRRTDEGHNLRGKVRLVFTEVKKVDGLLTEDLHPVTQGIGENLNVDGVINLVSSRDRMYGIKIVNDSSIPLYAALFYFDNSDFSIISLYHPPYAAQFKVDPPLRPNGSITLGYGSGGEVPYTYEVNKGQDVDVGFLKLFLSSEYVDFSDIPQLSPFKTVRHMRRADNLFRRISSWDTILVSVVIRRGCRQSIILSA